MAVAVIAVPKYYLAYIFCFIAFRLFDILKPFPVNASQKLPHGWGVMMDDVVAGTFSNIIVQIIFRLLIKFPIHAC
jgi:phosphatidylglycerophosphatase A